MRKIIFLRGLPGSGKTSISNSLSEKLGWKVIKIDQFKSDYMREHPDADFLSEVVPHSYARAIETIKGIEDENIIVEELFRSIDLVISMQDLSRKKNMSQHWFKLERSMEALIKVGKERKRSIKNSPEVLNKMKDDLDSISIENEVVLEGEDLNMKFRKILDTIK